MFFMVKIQMYAIFIHNPPSLGEKNLPSDAIFLNKSRISHQRNGISEA